jgi:hypothetical protein
MGRTVRAATARGRRTSSRRRLENERKRISRWVRATAIATVGLLAPTCDVAIPVVERLPADPPDSAVSTPPDSGGLGSGPFGAPTLIAAVSDPQSDNEDPSLTADELEIYFMSTRGGSTAVWVAARASAGGDWGAAQAVAEINSSAGEAEPFIAQDGLTLWFTRNGESDAGADHHIWVTTRATRTTPWNTPQPVSELWSSTGSDGKASVDQAQLLMVLASNRAGGAGGYDIYMSSRATTGDPWSTPVNVSAVNTTDDERDPFIGPQDLQLFWADDGPNEEILGAMRSSVADAFSTNEVLGELGTPDFDDWFSPDLHHVVFARGPAGSQEIYEAFR